MNKSKFLFLYFLLMLCFTSQAQDPVYSQFYNAPTLINPAFAGNTRGANVAINYRNQWPSIDNAYTTYSLAYDQKWNKNSGLGLYVTSDDAGDGAIKTTKLAGIYSYKIRIQNDLYIKGALDVAFGQTRLDQSKLVFLDNLDPQYGLNSPGGVELQTAEVLSSSPSRSYLDISSGFLLYSPQFYGGLSFKHMNSPSIDFIDDVTGEEGILPLRWSAIVGTQIDLQQGGTYRNKNNSTTFISPNLLFVKQQDFWQINAGAYLNVDQIFGGLWYRHTAHNSDAIIFSAGVKSGIFKIGYSFDYTISGLGINSGGSHEIGIVLNFDKYMPKESKYNDCMMLFR